MNTALPLKSATARPLPEARLIDVRSSDGSRHLYFAPLNHVSELQQNRLCETVYYRSGQIRHVKLLGRSRGLISTVAQASITVTHQGDKQSNLNFQHKGSRQ